MPETKEIGFVTACSKFFGRKSDQDIKGFKEELQSLTDEDRAALAPLLSEVLGTPVSLTSK